MADEPQLSVPSSQARDLARRVAKRENRSIADIVDRALVAYDSSATGREPAETFYRRMASDEKDDVDLEALIRRDRSRKPGIDL